MRRVLARLCRGTSAMLLVGLCSTALSSERPNIVYILADDLGWKDVGFHAGKPQTPNLDRLAGAGVRLEKFYTLPNSTPTRAALMTGRYPMRFGLQTLSILPWSTYGLPLDERTLPQALKQAGYRTAAFGEWLLGHASKDMRPANRGFDYFYGSFNGGIDQFKKVNRIGEPDWRRGEQALKEDGFATTLIARDAAAYISRHDTKRPLFVYVSFPAPAAPLQAPREYLDRYKDVDLQERRAYYAMISVLDDAVGTIVNALQQKGMFDNTLLVFHSDNGGAVRNKFPTGDGDVPRKVADNGPFHNGRGGLHEGAIRVVALAVWPGHIQPGVAAERIHVTDMYPTLLGLAGANLDQTKPIDGVDVWEVIAGGNSPRAKKC
ncbi:MAG: arylsulfatase B [Burkholderiales bacterium]